MDIGPDITCEKLCETQVHQSVHCHSWYVLQNIPERSDDVTES